MSTWGRLFGSKKNRRKTLKKAVGQSTGVVGASLGDPYAGSNARDLMNGSRSSAAGQMLNQVR